MAEKTDHKTLGLTFLVSGIGLAVSLALTLGWVYAPAGAALAIVGLVFLLKDQQA